MAGFTTLNNIPLSIKAKIDATVLLDPVANYVYAKTALMKSLPLGHGDTVRFPKYSRPLPFPTPLPESELDVDPQVLSKTFIDAEIAYYGTHFLISERTVDQNPEDVLRVHAGALNEALRETEDILVREKLLTTTTNIRCVSGENGDNPTEITEKDLSTVISTLTAYQAKPVVNPIGATDKFGTSPAPQGFIGIVHPDLIPDLEAMPNFVTLEKYGSHKPMIGEWGFYSRIRMQQTTQAPKESATSALGKTVYSNLILGKDAFAIIKQDARNATVVGPKKVGALEDKYQYGIKTSFAVALLFEQHVANLTCTRSTELV